MLDAGRAAPTFRKRQAQCGDISSSVLNGRLRELRDAGMVSMEFGGYQLAPRARACCARSLHSTCGPTAGPAHGALNQS